MKKIRAALGAIALLLGYLLVGASETPLANESTRARTDRMPSNELAELEAERVSLQSTLQALSDPIGLDLDKRDLTRGIDPPTGLFPD